MAPRLRPAPPADQARLRTAGLRAHLSSPPPSLSLSLSSSCQLEDRSALVWGGGEGKLLRCSSEFTSGAGRSCSSFERLRMGKTGGWITGAAVGGGIEHFVEGSFAVGIVTTVELAGHEHSELKVELKGWLVDEWHTVAEWQTIAPEDESVVRTIGSAVGEVAAHGRRVFRAPISLGLCDGVRVSVRHRFPDADIWLGCVALRIWARGRRAKRVGDQVKTAGWGALLDVAARSIDGI